MKLRNSKNKNLIKAANKFQPWDYAFLLELEKHSLAIMLEYYSKREDPTDDDKRITRYINLALKLLDIVFEIDTSVKFNFYGPESKRYVSIKYVNSQNWNRFFPENPNNKDKDSVLLKDVLRREKAWHLYNLIREKEMRYWWT